MNTKFFVAWLVVAVLWFAGVYVINVYLILSDWMPVPILRTWDQELQRYHFMVLPFILYAGAAVWIFKNFARRQRWIGQGLEYGAVLALITIIPMRMLNYASMQLPGAVLVKESVYTTILLLVIGVVIAWFYRDSSDAK